MQVILLVHLFFSLSRKQIHFLKYIKEKEIKEF
mgnify:FL=1